MDMLLSAILAASLILQNPEDTGPYTVSQQDVTHGDAYYGRGTVSGRIYYPNSSNNQPFPLVAFMHGWIEPASDYDDLCQHIASWGYVVYSNDTETSFFATLQAEAADTRAALQWVEDESQNPNSWLYEMTANQPWAAIGHSMGGAAVASLARLDSRVQYAVMLAPYKGSLLGNTDGAFYWFNRFEGSALVIGADEDLTNSWSSQVRPWYNTSTSSSRKLWALIDGGDHFGCTDPDIQGLWGNGSLSGPEQHKAYRKLVTAFLLAEVANEENKYANFFETNNATTEGSSINTPLWSTHDINNNTINLGTFSKPQNVIRLAISPDIGSQQTNFGELFLDLTTLRVISRSLAPLEGLVTYSLPVRASWSGANLYFQALATSSGSGSLSALSIISLP